MFGTLMLNKFHVSELEYVKEINNLDKAGFYYVKVCSPNLKYPVLPFRLKNQYTGENEVYFSNGIFDGLYFSEELKLFLKMGGKIMQFSYAYIYKEDKTKAIFKEFSQFCIEKRLSSEFAKKF
jgi:hypothetical protein